MKTRQQRLAEERAGHPPSPPQSLPVNQRERRRARSNMPGATVAAGSVIPAAESVVAEEPQALIRVWVDAGPEPSRSEPTHQIMFRSADLPVVVTFLENICSGSNEIQSPHHEISEQEVQEPIDAKKPEPVTADKPGKRRNNAFRRNPKMGISAELLASASAANNDIPMIFRDGFDFTANEPRYTGEDWSMNGISKTGNTIGRSADPSIQVAASELKLASQAPQASKWSLGSLYQSACSFTRRLITSPISSVPENPEPSLQAVTTSASQAITESTAPAQPKKKSSATSSAKDKRAKSRRLDNLAVNPVNAATASANQGNRRARAKKAKPVSDNTNATGAQDKESPPGNGTHADIGKGEAQETGAWAPVEGQNIRWPSSRWLDRWNADNNKRKRNQDDVGSHGRGAIDHPEDGSHTEEQPGKRRRTGQQILPKTPIPVTNREGTFKVPSPGDSDWSDSGSEEDGGNNAGLEDSKPSRRLGPVEAAALRKARDNSQKYKPPKSSRLCYSRNAYPIPSPPAAVAGRRQSNPSPLLAGDPEKRQTRPQAATKPSDTSANLEPSGQIRKFTAFQDWCQTASPAVIATVEKIDVDSNMAGNAVERALNRGANQHNAYEEWCWTAPIAVVAALEHMEVDSNKAGQAFMLGLDKFTEPK